jgi:hypothetical protein
MKYNKQNTALKTRLFMESFSRFRNGWLSPKRIFVQAKEGEGYTGVSGIIRGGPRFFHQAGSLH